MMCRVKGKPSRNVRFLAEDLEFGEREERKTEQSKKE